MGYGISSFVWTSPFSDATLDLLDKAKDMGFDYFEICIEDPSTINVHKIKPALQRVGIGALICGAFGPARDISSEDPQIRQQGIEYIKCCVDFAAQLNSDLVSGPMYSATGKARLLTDSEKEQQWDWAVEGLKVCADYAAAKGVKLAIEPLNRFETDFINTVDQGLELLTRIGYDNVGFLLDTFHMNIEEVDIAAAIERASGKVFNFHACSNTRGTPGEDHLDWASIAKALDRIGYTGPIVIESFTTKITEIAKAVSLWRPLAASQDELARKGLAFLKKTFG
ncbi:MAG: TIM barrel protein [Mahellales bacterium]|jgi:D-psicose/D-tagatose/L-ribulose 3-epimerase